MLLQLVFLLSVIPTTIHAFGFLDKLAEFNARNRAEAYYAFQQCLGASGINSQLPQGSESKKPTEPTRPRPRMRIPKIQDLHGIPPAIPDLIERYKRANEDELNAMPSMLLFAGPSGSGKTLAARVMVQELGYELEQIAGFDFAGRYIGEAKEGIAGLFTRLRASQKPTILLVEELETLIGVNAVTTHAEYKNAAAQFMRELADARNSKIIVVGTVTDLDELPKGFTDKGDVQSQVIEFNLPNGEHRAAMLQALCATSQAVLSDENMQALIHASHLLTAQDLRVAFQAARAEPGLLQDGHRLMQSLSTSFERKRHERNEELKRTAAKKESLYVEIADPQVSVNDFAGGLPEALITIVEKFNNRQPEVLRGLLLYGPPGTGKTTLAEAFAYQAHAKFMNISTSDLNRAEMGSGADRLQSLFKQARKYLSQNPREKVVMFFDEFDSIGKAGVNQEYSTTINALKKALSNIEKDGLSIFVIAATNHKTSIDDALIRAGRFDVKLEMPVPNPVQRAAVLRHYFLPSMRAMPERLEDGSLSLIGSLVQQTDGFSTADLKSLVTKAKMRVRIHDAHLEQQHFDEALAEYDVERRARLKEAMPYLENDPSCSLQNIIGAPLAVRDCISNLRERAVKGGKSRGFLLYGPPGTGKTSIAKAIAQESGLQWAYLIGSEFSDLVEGTKKIENIFAQLRSLKKPVVLIVDEVDTIGGIKDQIKQDSYNAGNAKYFWNKLSDTKNESIFVIGITNCYSDLDEGLKRSGRFDYQLNIGLPDDITRSNILKHYCSAVGFPLGEANMAPLLKSTKAMTGADINCLVMRARNDFRVAAERQNRQGTPQENFNWYLAGLLELTRLARKEAGEAAANEFGIVVKQPAKRLSDIIGKVDTEVNGLIQLFKKGQNNFTHKPKQGLLLYGPPGTGKTLLAEAFAGECGVKFISLSGSSFSNKYIGEGARMIRELFALIKNEVAEDGVKVVVFIDEIETLIANRGNEGDSTHSEDNKMVTELLTQLSGIEEMSDRIFLIGATNRVDATDQAAIRNGRFSTQVKVDLPDAEDRKKMLCEFLSKPGMKHNIFGSDAEATNNINALRTIPQLLFKTGKMAANLVSAVAQQKEKEDRAKMLNLASFASKAVFSSQNNADFFAKQAKENEEKKVMVQLDDEPTNALDWLVKETNGFSPVDLSSLVICAANLATQRNETIVTLQHLKDVLPGEKQASEMRKKPRKNLQEKIFEHQRIMGAQQARMSEQQQALAERSLAHQIESAKSANSIASKGLVTQIASGVVSSGALGPVGGLVSYFIS